LKEEKNAGIFNRYTRKKAVEEEEEEKSCSKAKRGKRREGKWSEV